MQYTMRAYVKQLTESKTVLSLQEFMNELATRFYPNDDLSFMEYFLSLTSEESDGKFVVHHRKLFEYGIAMSHRSNNLRNRLFNLGLTENEDYKVVKVQKKFDSGTKYSNEFLLTPEAFKLSLIRARRNDSQTIDVARYAKYYLFLEKALAFYSRYQHEIDSDLLKTKSKKIDEMATQIQTLLAETKKVNTVLSEGLDDIAETKETVELIKAIAVENDPLNLVEDVDQYYSAATTYTAPSGVIVVKFISGQYAYVLATLRERASRFKHQVAVKIFHSKQIIDLRLEAFDKFEERRCKRIIELNDERCIKDRQFNERLMRDIRVYNRANPNDRRKFSEEKQSSTKLLPTDIDVKFKKTSFSYKPNRFMGFDETLQIILGTLQAKD